VSTLKGLLRQGLLGAALMALLFGMKIPHQALAAGQPSLKVISPADGATITSTDIAVTVEVSDFKLAPEHVGLPDQEGEGHIHVMIDGMNMGVLFNFYTDTTFTLPGEGIAPGPHTLIFDLASNTHMDMPDTVQEVKINYQPTTPKPAPAPAATAGTPEVQIISPADGATVGPRFTMEVKPSNFTPALDLEGKPNLAGYGHYHVFVDMDMSSMSGDMMSMAGMVGMPGSNSFPVDLSAWPAGKHTITVELVQNDHTPIEGANPAMIAISLQGAAPATLPTTGGDNTPATPVPPVVLFGAVLLTGALLLRLWTTRRT